VNFNFKIINATYVFFLQNRFSSIISITVKSFMHCGGDLEVVLVKKLGVKTTVTVCGS
jgi:hypothetical protein